jgi:hypothetical protein
MRRSNWIAMMVLALVGCGGEPEAVSVSQEPTLWAACTAEAICPSTENCYDLRFGGPEVGQCEQLCNDSETSCTSPAQCTVQEPFCCRSLPCIQDELTEPNDRYFYIAGVQSGCHTGMTCQPCPAGKVRNRSAPGDSACCTPTLNCTGHCGTVYDSCGWPQSCGGCPNGQTCTINGCCRLTQAQACAGKTCGTVSDGCGGTYNCGSCGNHQYCGTFNYCYCDIGYNNCGDSPPALPSCSVTCQ